tara:strand:- start:769 stop:1134 length:366 start_codon:yes stop_codon:yes gene_type:complete
MRNQNEIEKPSARIKIVAHKIDLAMASTLDQISWFAGVSQMSLSEKKGHQEIVDNLQDVFASLKNARAQIQDKSTPIAESLDPKKPEGGLASIDGKTKAYALVGLAIGAIVLIGARKWGMV